MDVFKEIGSLLKGAVGWIPKAIHIVLWGLSAIIILPCVFVTHFIYPLWEKWGKEF